MAKSSVYFSNARSLHFRYAYSLPAKLKRLLEVANLKEYIPSKKPVAVKTHFGSWGAFRMVRPAFLRIIVDAVKDAGGTPFVTDTGDLSKLEIAARNGITPLSVGAPVILAGGVTDRDGVVIKTGGDLIGEIAVAGAIYDAAAMVVVSHSKGHLQPGYAGAIKNVAMGCVTTRNRKGEIQRGRMHTQGEAPFRWNADLCTLCGQCVEVCSFVNSALSIQEDKVVLNPKKCWRCARCVRVCPTGAMSVDFDEESFAKGMAESSNAVLSTFKPGRVLYVNFVMDFQPECDCMPMADTAIIQDQGILISNDAVAIDAAALDLVGKAKPLPQSRAEDQGIKEASADFIKNVLGRDPWIQVKIAEKMGLGNREYELIQIEPDE